MRTFIPVSAGIAKLEWKKFTRYNLIGIAGWAAGVTLLGAALGTNEWVKHNLELVLVGFVVLSFIPIAVEVLRNWKKR
jgi:membrane-associated protein